MAEKFERICKVAGVQHGLVFGWLATATEKSAKGERLPHFDLQGDYLPMDALIEAGADFMAKSREAREQHQPGERGAVLFCLPMDESIAKGLGLKLGKFEGLIIGMKPTPDMLAKFESGELSGFSLGGSALEIVEVENAKA